MYTDYYYLKKYKLLSGQPGISNQLCNNTYFALIYCVLLSYIRYEYQLSYQRSYPSCHWPYDTSIRNIHLDNQFRTAYLHNTDLYTYVTKPYSSAFRYIPSATTVSFSWSGFKFLLPVKFYQWGMGTVDPAQTAVTCEMLVGAIVIL